MKTFCYACASLACVAIAALCTVLAWQSWHVPAQAAADLTARADRLEAELRSLRPDINEQIGKTRQEFLCEIAAWRKTLDARFASVQDNAAGALETATARADARAGEITAAVQAFRADLAPTLANAASITGHANEASAVLFRRDALPAQLLGTLGAAKVTLGQTAQTMRSIERATPPLLAGVQQVVDNSNRTTDATAAVMQNFREATKPLPTWLRITLGVAPPLASTAAGAATVYSLGH